MLWLFKSGHSFWNIPKGKQDNHFWDRWNRSSIYLNAITILFTSLHIIQQLYLIVKSTKTLYFSKEYHDYKLMFLRIQKLMLSYISMLKASKYWQGLESKCTTRHKIKFKWLYLRKARAIRVKNDIKRITCYLNFPMWSCWQLNYCIMYPMKDQR